MRIVMSNANVVSEIDACIYFRAECSVAEGNVVETSKCLNSRDFSTSLRFGRNDNGVEPAYVEKQKSGADTQSALGYLTCI